MGGGARQPGDSPATCVTLAVADQPIVPILAPASHTGMRRGQKADQLRYVIEQSLTTQLDGINARCARSPKKPPGRRSLALPPAPVGPRANGSRRRRVISILQRLSG